MCLSETEKNMENSRGYVWLWGSRLRAPLGKENLAMIEDMARELGVKLLWGEPIHPGDLYLAARNTGPRLLTCRALGEGCVHPVEFPEYSYDMNECVKIRET
jgi:hypothetical protein